MEEAHTRRYLVSFDALLLPQVFCDVLIIGSGIAGLRAALAASDHADVLVIAKRRADENNTSDAQGGIAVAMGPGDDPKAHAADTVEAGQGLCSVEVVEAITADAPEHLRQLIEWGAEFDREGGTIAFAREGGHSAARVAHANGDATGRELERVLLARAEDNPRIRLIEHSYVIDLITVEGEGCRGALIQNLHHGRMVIWARQTVLATGGCGRVYRETTNPSGATGDGVAMAYRAGADLADVEFYQFHPTALYIAGAGRALISEAVRGEGAHLLNVRRERFMQRYHELGELAPRDAVSRAIVTEIRETGHICAYLDMRHIPEERLAMRFPAIRDLCAQYDIDIARDLVPIRPAAHYMVGGVRVDLAGRSDVEKLYACGEVACSGFHGANRLGSNSLLEGLVLGARAGTEAGRRAASDRNAAMHPRISYQVRAPKHAEVDVADVTNALRAVAWRSLGIERNHFGIEEALHSMRFWSRYVMEKEFNDVPGWQLQNMLTVARCLAQASLIREESRGVHYRTDFPERDDATWSKHIVLRSDVEPVTEPVRPHARASDE